LYHCVTTQRSCRNVDIQAVQARKVATGLFINDATALQRCAAVHVAEDGCAKERMVGEVLASDLLFLKCVPGDHTRMTDCQKICMMWTSSPQGMHPRKNETAKTNLDFIA